MVSTILDYQHATVAGITLNNIYGRNVLILLISLQIYTKVKSGYRISNLKYKEIRLLVVSLNIRWIL
jgi:hypothetical protein